jgi:transposase-like protein
MHNKAFGRLLEQLQKLTFEQTKKVDKYLHTKFSIENLEEITGEVKQCPHCHSESFYKWGVRSGLQRYRCKACNKTFNALTHTSLARLRHKEVWIDYAQDLIEGRSIRQCASHCHVDKSTTFRWRHRMLKVPTKTKAEHLHGIVEFDETYFLESHKGERDLEHKPRKRGGKASKRGVSSEQTAVLIVRDRNGNTTDAILTKSNQETIAKVMLPIVDSDALLCSDTKPSYKAFAKKYHFELKTINVSAKEHVKGIYHVQNVNAYDSRLKAWMQHFHGVATKYLDCYLGWMRLLDREKNITAKQLLAVISGRNFVLQPLMRT